MFLAVVVLGGGQPAARSLLEPIALADVPQRTAKFNFPARIRLTGLVGGGSGLMTLFSVLNIFLKEYLRRGGWIIFSTHFDRAGIIQAAAAVVSFAALKGFFSSVSG